MNAGFETDSWTNQTSLEDYLQKKKMEHYRSSFVWLVGPHVRWL